MRWGLVPAFAERLEDFDAFKGGSSTFNARVEGVSSSGLWRRLLDKRRGVVLLDGFYEWRADGKSKVPMFIRNRDEYNGDVIADAKGDDASHGFETPSKDGASGPSHAPLLLAALHDSWRAKKQAAGPGDSKVHDDEDVLESTAILTMDPMGTAMEKVHDRMPVFLTPETAALWLDPTKSFADVVQTVLASSAAHARSELHLYEVSSLVSKVGNESPDCILPKKEYDSRQLSKGLGRFFKRKNEAEPAPEKVGATSTAAPPAKVARTGQRPVAEVVDLDD